MVATDCSRARTRKEGEGDDAKRSSTRASGKERRKRAQSESMCAQVCVREYVGQREREGSGEGREGGEEMQ